jgi:hypothetical protein
LSATAHVASHVVVERASRRRSGVVAARQMPTNTSGTFDDAAGSSKATKRTHEVVVEAAVALDLAQGFGRRLHCKASAEDLRVVNHPLDVGLEAPARIEGVVLVVGVDESAWICRDLCNECNEESGDGDGRGGGQKRMGVSQPAFARGGLGLDRTRTLRSRSREGPAAGRWSAAHRLPEGGSSALDTHPTL